MKTFLALFAVTLSSDNPACPKGLPVAASLHNLGQLTCGGIIGILGYCTAAFPQQTY